MDLEKLRPGDWLNLRDDLQSFFRSQEGGETLADSGGLLTMPLEPPFPKEFTKENFEVLQKDVHEIIDSVAKDKKGKFKPKKLSSLRYSILPLFGEGAVLNATGTAHDTFILKLFFLLFTQPLAKVRSCPLCGTIFYRSGKQKYCSLINVK